MRNSGWYIPFWRRPKKKGKAEKTGAEEVTRSDEQLEAVRRRWIERYRRTVRALGLLGLSMGSGRAEVQAAYEQLRRSGAVSPRELEEAYRYLLRVLPAQERRKRRVHPKGTRETLAPPDPAASPLQDSTTQAPDLQPDAGDEVIEVEAEAGDGVEAEDAPFEENDAASEEDDAPAEAKNEGWPQGFEP